MMTRCIVLKQCKTGAVQISAIHSFTFSNIGRESNVANSIGAIVFGGMSGFGSFLFQLLPIAGIVALHISVIICAVVFGGTRVNIDW